jgi:hypothetical protein
MNKVSVSPVPIILMIVGIVFLTIGNIMYMVDYGQRAKRLAAQDMECRALNAITIYRPDKDEYTCFKPFTL